MKKMKSYSIITLLFSLLMAFYSCDDDFENINRSPATVYEVDPITFLHNVQLNASTAGSTWWDSYATRLRWLQYSSNIWGYAQNNFTDIGIGGDLYSEYNEMGSYVTHIPHYIKDNMPEEIDAYSDLIDISRVMLIYKGIQTSDMYGSLVYSDGWGTRGDNPDEIEPSFQIQEELYNIWDTELKEIGNRLGTITDQKDFASYDHAYNGDISKWKKAANALRLRIALRLWNRLPDIAETIAGEVLGSGDIFESIDDSFILYFDSEWTNQGDWHSIIDMDRAAAPFMNYLKEYNDPRKRIFFQPNNLTPENISKYNDEQEDPADQIPTDLTQWEGGTVSFDKRASDPSYIARSMSDGTDMMAMNKPQTRLWKGAYDGGSGGGWAPLVTYADFCFMASEFVLEGISSSKTAQEWYEDGVKASLKQWSELAAYSQIKGYEPITDAEIQDFMTQPDIAWNPAMAKEQIYSQTWVEDLKNNNESWALWKRTGYPNQNSSIVTFDPVLVLNQEQDIPRRKQFTVPVPGSPNYDNEKERFDTMKEDPNFGDLNDEFGRLWWDVK